MLCRINSLGTTLPVGSLVSMSLKDLLNKNPFLTASEVNGIPCAPLQILKARLAFVSVETVEESVFLNQFVEELKKKEKILLVRTLENATEPSAVFNGCLFEGQSLKKYSDDVAIYYDQEKARKDRIPDHDHKSVLMPLVLDGLQTGLFDGYELRFSTKRPGFYEYKGGKSEKIKCLAGGDKINDFANRLLGYEELVYDPIPWTIAMLW